MTPSNVEEIVSYELKKKKTCEWVQNQTMY